MPNLAVAVELPFAQMVRRAVGVMARCEAPAREETNLSQTAGDLK